MSPSSNQRRAMPVVTMMTFHVGVSGVASRSRLTTPTCSSVGAEDLFGDRANGERLSGAGAGDDAEARPPRASSRTRAPWCFSR